MDFLACSLNNVPHAISGVLPGANEYRASVQLTNGTYHDIMLEYREDDGAASVQVRDVDVLTRSFKEYVIMCTSPTF